MSETDTRQRDDDPDDRQLWSGLKIIGTIVAVGFLALYQYSRQGGPMMREMIRIEMLGGDGRYDEVIEATTRMIAEHPTFEWPHTTRGEAYRRKGDLDHAFADFDEAIRLEPKSADAYYQRCLAFRHKGELDRALADCQESARIKPAWAALTGVAALQLDRGELERAYDSLGAVITVEADSAMPAASFYRGQLALFRFDRPADAAADLAKATDLAMSAYTLRSELGSALPPTPSTARDYIELPFSFWPDGIYLLVWNHIAHVRTGQDDAKDLADQLDKVKSPYWNGLSTLATVQAEAERKALAQWPGAIFALFLGKATPDAVRAAAEQASEPTRRAKQICDADFYIGEYQLEKGAAEQARTLLQSAAETCPAAAREATFARFELERLGAQR